MPMNRYEMRNEYSLADPELYRAADKDDPEALLEGVAMAGLVGVLRQLGDLAEFAAEIFHDLHEEVMTTAARGHSLMIRVQQLEAEVPSIEKAFLSQTDHSSFFYNAGVDWHPNLQMDQNLVTHGDLPRFVMDSYEECRGPPRLFLLDKFDVAGAGACLKRYTDPSFFKVETSAMANADVQREKKIRKTKKKGPRGRYGETPEVLPALHSKIHQLLLKDPDENVVSKPSHRAKLKRRQNGFPFDSKSGKSYMEKILKTPSPEHKMLYDITTTSPLRMSINDHNEADLDVLELRTVGPAEESEGRNINPPPPDREDTILNPFMNQTNDESTDIKVFEVPSYLNIVTDGVPSTFGEENGEKDIPVCGESKTDGSLTGYQSDEIASEIDNYVDAPSTMESEMDTDSELRVKNDFTSSYMKRQPLVSVESEEHLRSQSSDSQSTGGLTISDDVSNSCKKEVSSFLSSNSSRTSVENPQVQQLSPEGSPSADIPEIAVRNASSYQKTAHEDFPVDGLPEPVESTNTFPGKDALPNNRADFEQLSSDLCSSNSIATLLHYDSGGVAKDGRLMGPKSDEMASTSDDEEKKINLIAGSSSSRSVSCSKSVSGDDSPRSSSGEHLVDDESAPRMSATADVTYHTSHSSAAISAYLLHEDDNDLEDLDQFGNRTSTINMRNVLSQNRIDTEERISNGSQILGKLDSEVTKLPDNFASDSTVIAHNGDDFTSETPQGENQNDDFYDEDSNVVSDSANRSSCIVEASTGTEHRKAPLTNTETVDSEDHYSNTSIVNQISSETLVLSGIKDSPHLLEAGLDAHDRDFIPEETTANEIRELGTPTSCEVVGLQGTGITDDITRNDLVGPKSSFCPPENLENPAWTSDTAEKDGICPDRGVTGLELTEISSSADLKLLGEVHVLLDESNSKSDQSETGVMGCSVPAISDNAIRENVILPAGLDELVEEHIPFVDNSGQGKHENDKTSLSGSNRASELVKEDKNYLSGSYGQSGLVEEVDETEAATLDYQTVFCSTETNDHPKSEAPDTIFNSFLDSEVEHSVDFVSAAQIQSPLEQSGFDTDQKSFQQSGAENQVPYANSLPVDCVTEEMMLQEKIVLPPDRVDQETPVSDDISLELSSLSPIDHQIMLDHVNNEGHNNFASLFPFANHPPSVSGVSGLRDYGIDVSAYPKDPRGFFFPPGNLLSSTNQSNLDESPPLPPLPPLQWRMGKIQHALSTTEIDKIEHKEVFPPEISPPAASTGSVGSSLEQMYHLPIQMAPQISLKEENVRQNALSTTEVDEMEYKEEFPREISPYAEPTGNVCSSLEEVTHSEIQIVPHVSLKEETVEHSSPSSEANSMHDTIDLALKIKNEEPRLVMPTQKNEVTSPAEEDGVANGSQSVKLPRACNPVIGSVAALDKSKLRKVTERDSPQIQKSDERDSLLEQIRAKSFNLKPAVASRPSIQGPTTNLKVAAILEKANAIRQALAGSDEDDEDNWSDS